jgi:S-DNA-T family DNA segregation ATPase FtsK/SpoIIIE
MSLKNRSKYYNQKKRAASKKEINIKTEVIGLLLISIGILLFLAIYSYDQTDPVGKLGENNPKEINNYLGIVGASLSSPVFQATFGYPSIVFPIILLILGVTYLIRYPTKKLTVPIILLIFWAYLISIALALPSSMKSGGNTLNFYPSGFFGGFSSDFLIKYFGNFAAIFLLFIFLIILAIFSFKIKFSTISIYLGNYLKKFFGFLISVLGIIINFLPYVFRKFKKRKRKSFQRYEEELPEMGTEIKFTPSYKSKSLDIDETKSTKGVEVIKPAEKSEPQVDLNNANDTLNDLEELIEFDKQKAIDIPPLLEEFNPTEEIENDYPDEIPFKIEESIKERELDYDSLVRDSLAKYQFPSVDLLIDDMFESTVSREELLENARLLEKTLGNFGVKATVKKVVEGPVITLYAVQPAEGVKINQIVSLSDDLALALRAKGIRMIAPIPGEAAIGIEIPNRHPSTVYFRSIVKSEKFINSTDNLVLGMGKTISGEIFCADLSKMPHLLIAGSTGSGKSVGINTIIASILYRVPPSDVKFVLIDPKKLELTLYAKLKDHYLAICPELDEIVITHPQNAILILRSVVNEMDERYDKLAHLGVRDIVSYNKKITDYREKGETSEEYRHLPYLIVVIDELADLILTAAREVEEPITRLAQMARAVGIHLIVATQRPSVDILTGLIKANFPTRIAYQVATRPDSKVILDMYGSEKMIGNGDMLFLPPGTGKPIRLQNPLITTEEVDRVIKHIRKQPKFPTYELKLIRNASSVGPGSVKAFERDELFEQAKEIVVRYQQGSISLLQRKLKIGYARGARLVDELEEAGIVGPGQGSKARDVLISSFNTE